MRDAATFSAPFSLSLRLNLLCCGAALGVVVKLQLESLTFVLAAAVQF